ncbi:MAG: hypothetical protein LBJ67_02300 [Planctomycetaceae bacterium]|jgi:hypothetical protein|nr:hypothetical protein [Planctomycetaceae bacterium]
MMKQFCFIVFVPIFVLTVGLSGLSVDNGYAQEAVVPAPVDVVSQPNPAPPLNIDEPKSAANAAKNTETQPDESYTRLTHPAVADRMGLDDNQRAKIQSLINERSQALAKAPIEQWDTIRAENEKKLETVLTPEQKANWLRVIHEKTIRFITRNQKWSDLLEWLANQVGLQLIMDAPPQGTCSYSDPTHEYTPTEAIDKINSILQANGYTLVRHDNLLLLFNLKRTPQIPLVYLRKIKPEDLAEQKGNFEFVAVTFPLGRRLREIVETRMKPFLGPYSQIVELPGNSFMLIETLTTQRVVQKLIEVLPEPEVPPRPEDPLRPDAPPPQNWQTYVIEKADIEKIEETIRLFCGITQMVRMPHSPQLHVLGTVDQQELVRQIVDRLEVDPSSENKPLLEVYSLEQLADASPERLWAMYRAYGLNANLFDVNASFTRELLDILKTVAPTALTAYEKNNRKLVVLAIPDEQKKVAELIEKLKKSPLSEEQPVIKVYTLTAGSMTFNKEVADSIEKLVPKAQVEFSARDRCLLVIGTADEHKLITETIKELENVSSDQVQRKVVCYPINQIQMVRFTRLFNQLSRQPEFEGVMELSEGRNNQLTIWATPEQHVLIKQVIDELLAIRDPNDPLNENDGNATPDGTNVPKNAPQKLAQKSFVLRRGNTYSVQYLLTQVIPGISVTVEPESRAMLVFGTQQAVESAEELVKNIEAEFGIDVIMIPLEEKLPDEALNTLRFMFRRFGGVSFDEKNMRLIVYGTKSDLDQVEAIVERFKKIDKNEPKSFYVQPVQQEMPDQIVAFVKDAVPHADIQYDKQNKRFTIAASAADQLLASKLILEAESTLPPPEEIRFFSVGTAVNENLINLIKNQIKNITEIKRDDQDPMTLFVKARPAVLEDIEKIIEQVKKQLPSAKLRTLQSYPVTKTQRTRFELLQDDLKKEIGDYRVMNDDRQNLLVIWATPQQQERIDSLLETIRAEVPAELKEQVITHSLKFTDSSTLQKLVQEIYPDIKINEDKANGRLIIRVPSQNADALKTLLAQIDSPDPDRVKRYFATYPVGNVNTVGADGVYRSYYHLLQELQALVPNAKLTYDYNGGNVVVWGTDEEQQIIKETIENVHNTKPADRFGRFPLRRADPYPLIAIVQRMFPAAPVSYDAAGKTLIVQSINGEQLQLIEALIQKLDPEEPGPNDPEVRFYQLSAEPPEYLLATIRQLAPTAYIVPDNINRQLMVLARPAEHDLIRKNVELIVSTFTPDEPVLFIYTVTNDERKRIEAFVETAAAELRGLRIIKDDTPGQISIWAKPTEHQLIADAIAMMKANSNSDFELQFSVFSLTGIDEATARSALTAIIPEAKPIYDEKGKRLLVQASKQDMEKVVKTLEQLDPNSTKNLKYMAYPVALGDPQIILESIKQVYPNIKSQVDERNKRLLIWATPEEHVAIAEMIEQTNTDPETALQEKYKSYSIPKLSYSSVTAMLKAFFPDAEVYGDALLSGAVRTTANSAVPTVTVRATSKEHERIAALLEQMQTAENPYQAVFAIYPMGESDPVTLEAMLQGMFPQAESLTSYEIKNLLEDDPQRQMRRINPFYGYGYGNNMPMNRVQRQIQTRTGDLQGCFKIDSATRSVMVFLPEEDQKKIAVAIESIAMASQFSGKMTFKTYELEAGYIYYYIPILQEIVPTAKISEGIGRDIAVYASESEHAKVQKFVDELNAAGKPDSQYTMFILTIPDGTGIARDLFIRRVNYSNDIAGYVTQAPLPNQIMFYGQRGGIPKIKKILDEMAAEQAKEGTAVTPKVYTLKYISFANAKKWLQAIVPNAQFDVESPNAIYNRYRYLFENFGIPMPTAQSTPDDPQMRMMVIRATPLDHQIIVEALKTLDADLPEEIKPVPQDYSFLQYPPPTMTLTYRALIDAFPPPTASFTLNSDRIAIVAIAPPRIQKEIQSFIDNFVKQKEEEQPCIEIYTLKNASYFRIQQVLNLAAPRVQGFQILPGVTPDQVVVYARPVDQQRIANVIAKLETMTVPEDGFSLKMYHVPPESIAAITPILQFQVSGGLAFPNPVNSTITVYGSSNDHAIAERLTKAMGEAFPEPMTKTYFTKNIPLGQAAGFLTPRFANRATFFMRTDTGDLIATASEEVHAEIQKTLDAIDVKRPAESERMVVVHDLTDLWVGAISWAIQGIQAASPTVLILPTSIPGQILVYATPTEQIKIQKVVDEMLAKHPEALSVTKTYTFTYTTAVSAVNQILNRVAPLAQFAYADHDVHKLYVRAKPTDHEKLEEAINTLNINTDLKTFPRMYRLERAGISTALVMLRAYFPGMSLTFDPEARAILAYASEEEHERVAAMVAEIDKDDPKTQVSLKIHPTGMANTQQLLAALRLFYGTSPYFSAVQDTTSRNLIVTATPRQHGMIDSLIQQIKEGGLKDPEITLKVYELEKLGASVYGVTAALGAFFQHEGIEFSPTVDYLNSRMMTLARPQEHAAIESILDSFRMEERILGTFVIQTLDLESVRLAVLQLFAEDSYAKRPIVQLDFYSDTVYVRATQTQLEQIRQLLVNMGETGTMIVGSNRVSANMPNIPPSTSNIGTSTNNTGMLRTIQLKGDSVETLRQLQNAWQHINPNNELIINQAEGEPYPK